MQKNEFFGQFHAFYVLAIFFIGLLVFAVEALENPKNRIFSKKAVFLEKMRFFGFSRASTAKTKSPMKKIAKA